MARYHERRQRGTARGNTRSADGRTRRPVWFHWTDPETGERLRVELWSSAAFLAGLETAGFEPVSRATAEEKRPEESDLAGLPRSCDAP